MKIKLYDYQEDMKGRIEGELRLHRSVMAQMPTGTGKTYLLTAVIDSFVSNNPMEKVWIVAHRRELVSQIDETVRKFHSYYASNTSSLLSSVKAMSIQWLMRHYDEIEEEPGMIVIDEAHHALAKTYKEMWERFPKAKFLGLTATPCRLNGKGFTDLFDVLVQSWSVPEFISKGRLATYDFVSIKSDGVTQRLIDSLQKRGADGDYQNKEMDMLLNKKPSIERLYQSLEEYGKDRKGIVYAINIRHANAIAEFYREHGIAAVAIDSKTPSSLRKELIERFKASNTSFSNHPIPLSKEGFSKITPQWSLHPLRLPRSRGTETLFTIKEGSTSHPDPLTLRGEGGNRPTRCSEPLRSKVGGPSKVFARLCGMGPPGEREFTIFNLQLIVYRLLIMAHGDGLLGGTTIFVPHRSIALRSSPLEWGIFFKYSAFYRREIKSSAVCSVTISTENQRLPKSFRDAPK